MPTTHARGYGRAARWAALALLVISAVPASSCAAEPAALPAGFIDDRGQRVDQRTLRRPLRLIAFGYTSCPDVCPLTLLAMHRALVHLAGDAAKIDPMFITVDPDRDSIAALHRYVGAFDARIRGYRGDPAQLARLASRLDVRYWRDSTGTDPRQYGMSHTATLFLLRRDGEIAARIDQTLNVDTLAQSIVSAVRALE